MRHDLADHEPVEQPADRGQALFRGGRGPHPAQGLDVGGDVERLDGRDRGDAPALAPFEEFSHSAGVGAAGVGVADRGGEEFQEADLRPLAGRCDEGRQG